MARRTREKDASMRSMIERRKLFFEPLEPRQLLAVATIEIKKSGGETVSSWRETNIEFEIEVTRTGSIPSLFAASSFTVVGVTGTGLATPGQDYEVTGTFSFGAGETVASGSGTLKIFQDQNQVSMDLQAETISLTLDGYACGGTGSMILVDDDGRLQPKTCNCPCACSDVATKADNANSQERSSVKSANLSRSSSSIQRPVIGGTAKLSATADTADIIEVIPRFDGVDGTSIFYDPSGMDVDEEYQFLAAVDASSVPSGRYEYELEIIEHYTSSPDVSTFIYGEQEIVRSHHPELGKGWAIADVDYLVVQADDGIGVVQGGSNLVWFDEDENGDYVLAPGNPISMTLEKLGGGGYELLSADGTLATFNTAGRLTSRADRLGNTTTFSYTDADSDSKVDEIEEIADPWGRVLTYAYDAGMLDTVTDETGRVVTFTFDGGNLVEVTEQDPDGAGPLSTQTTTFTYDADELLTDVTDDEGESITYDYDGNGRIEKMHRPGTEAESYTPTTESFSPALLYGLVDPDLAGTALNPSKLYLADEAAGSYTDALGNVTTFKVDRYGYPLEIIRDDDDSETDDVTTFERDHHGRVTKRTDPDPDEIGKGQPAPVTEYKYSDGGFIEKITHPDSSTEAWEYDPVFADVVAKYTNRRGKVTFYDVNSTTSLVDSERRVIGLDDASSMEIDDVVTAFTYTSAPAKSGDPPAGLVASVEDPLGRITEYEHSEFGQVTKITYAVGTADEAVEEFEYTDLRLTKYTDGVDRETLYEYDAYGRQIKVTYPDPDGEGPLTSPIEESFYNNLNQLIKTVDPLGRETTYKYDERGNLWQVSRPDHDGDTELTTTTYLYNEMNLLVSSKDPLDRVTEFTYDKLLRQDTTKLPEVADPSTAVNEIQVIDFDGGTTGTFKINGNAKSATIDLTKLTGLQSALDSLWGAGNTVVTYAAGEATVKFKGDFAATNVAQMTVTDVSGTGGPVPFVTTDTAGVAADLVNPELQTKYDSLGRVTKSIDALGNETKYSYANFGREITITLPDPDGGGALSAPTLYHEYDENGNLVEEHDANGGVTTYEYDDLDRLVKVTAPDPDGVGGVAAPVTEYEYDDAGNLRFTVDALSNVTEYEYDNRDRQVKVISADPDGGGALSELVTEYEYNDANELTSVIAPGSRETKYIYDGLGRTISVTAPDPDGGGALTAPVTKYAYDAAGQMIAMTDPLGNETLYGYDLLGNQFLVIFPDPDGVGLEDSPLTYREFDASGQLLTESPGLAKKEIQRLYFGSKSSYVTPLTDLSNMFSLNFDGDSTSTMLASSTSYDVQTNLEALDSIGYGNVVVTSAPGGFIIIFRGELAEQDVPPISSSSYVRTNEGIGYSVTPIQSAASGTNEVQTLDLGAATTGTFDIYGNGTSATVYSLDAYGIQSALDSLWGYGNTYVTQPGSYFSIAFQGSYAQQNITEMSIYSNSTDGSPYFSTSTQGDAGQHEIVQLALTGSPDSGNWIPLINSSGSTSTLLAANASASSIEYVLDANYSYYSPSGYSVTGSDGGPWNIETLSTTSPGTWSIQAINFIFGYDLSRTVSIEVEEVQPGGLVWWDTTTYEYDNLGQLIQVTYADPDGAGALESPVQQIAYDLAGNVYWAIDPLGNVTSYEYDSLQRLTKMTLPDPDDGGALAAPVYEYEYFSNGQLKSLTDPLGRETTYEYDGLWRQTKVTQPDPDGAWWAYSSPVTAYEYDAVGNLAKVTEPGGAVTEYDYDDIHRVTKITAPDPDGKGALTSPVTEYAYDAAGQLASVTDPLSRVTAYEYDDMGRTTKVTLPDPDGAGTLKSPVYGYAYDAASKLSEVTDPLGNVTKYAYDHMQRLISVTQPDPDGKGSLAAPITSYTYDFASRLLTSTDPLNRVTSYEYDGLGRTTQVTLPDPDGGGVLAAPVTKYAYDAANDLQTVTDPLGRVTNYSYDNLHRQIKITLPDPDGVGAQTSPLWSYAYDAAGQLLSQTDPLSRVTSYAYDNVGRLKTVTLPDPDGGGALSTPVTSYFYDPAGNIQQIVDARGYVTAYDYDDLHRRTKVTLPDPDGVGSQASPVWEYSYDPANQLLDQTDPMDRKTSFTYDKLGRTLSVTQPDPDGVGGVSSPVTSYEYDAVGNLLTVTDPLTHVTTYGYDNLYRRTSITDALSGVTSFTFDAAGQLKSLTDPVSNTTEWFYDGLGRVTQEKNELNKSRYFEYDAVGNLTERTDRNGRVIQYVYDNLNRNTEEKWYESASLIRTITFEFDGADQLTSVDDPSATNLFTYDKLGRVTQEVQTITGFDDTLQLAQEFDALGNRTKAELTYGTAATLRTDYLYDGLSRMKLLTQYDSTSSDIAWKRVTFEYNAAGQFSEIERFVLPIYYTPVVTTTYEYDGIGRLTDLLHFTDTTTWSGYEYEYDAASRITEIDSFVDGLTEYDYDDTNQLTDADHAALTDEEYEYDANGNRDMSGYDIDPNNQLASDGTYTYEYDDEGNRISRANIATGYVTEYEWDHRNRLTKVTEFDDEENELSIVTYTYDAFDRWVTRSHDADGPGGSAAIDTIFAHDGDQIALEFSDETGNVSGDDLTHTYSWGPVIDQLLADEAFGEEPLWALSDHLGTPRDLVAYDEIAEETELRNHRVFDSFGNLDSQTSVIYVTSIGFTGRHFDEVTRLANHRGRWVDVSVGIWISQDPSGFSSADANLVRYVSNSPAIFVDTSGLINKDFSRLFFGGSISFLGDVVTYYFGSAQDRGSLNWEMDQIGRRVPLWDGVREVVEGIERSTIQIPMVPITGILSPTPSRFQGTYLVPVNAGLALDGLQVAVDVIGIFQVPGFDAVNGIVGLLRGDYVGATIDFASEAGGDILKIYDIPKVAYRLFNHGRRILCNKAANLAAQGGSTIVHGLGGLLSKLPWNKPKPAARPAGKVPPAAKLPIIQAPKPKPGPTKQPSPGITTQNLRPNASPGITGTPVAGLASSGGLELPRGDILASPELIKQLEKHNVVDMSREAQELLRNRPNGPANATVGFNRVITLSPDARRIEVYEELIHSSWIDILIRRGWVKCAEDLEQFRILIEIDTHEFLLRKAEDLQLTPIEVDALRQRLTMWEDHREVLKMEEEIKRHGWRK